MLLLAPILVLPLFSPATARLHSLPEDPYAFPKFKVSFLSALPILNQTAQKWLDQGIPGGEAEFLNQPFDRTTHRVPLSLKEIDDGSSADSGSFPSNNIIPYSLEYMKMGPRDTYLCLVPKPLDLSPPLSEDEIDQDITPARSWSLLQPLSGTCIYHRQGWFTYSYCHNDQIRQFKELPQGQSLAPEEDHSWESYTLGKAPATPEPGADLTVAERDAIEANLELARGAGSRYLVQRWGDGTLCDKTGKGREVEVQFHCSMTMSDTILFVKETKTCSYVLVINTPRLCGEPGFRSHRDVGEQAQIRCREIVHTLPQELPDVPETDHPRKIPRVEKMLPSKAAQTLEKGNADDTQGNTLRKTLEAFLGGQSNGQVFLQQVTDDGEMVFEFLDDLPEDGSGEGDGIDAELERITNTLRAAGFNIKGDRGSQKATSGESNESKQKNQQGSDSKGIPSDRDNALEQVRDEL